MYLAFGEGLVGAVASRREPLALSDARSHPQVRYFPETGEERYRSFMATPLVVRNVTIGVLVVQTVEPRVFERGDVELLQTCGQLLAPIVMNAQLLAFVDQSEEERDRIVTELAHSGLPRSAGTAARCLSPSRRWSSTSTRSIPASSCRR